MMKATNIFGRGFGDRKCKLILEKYPQILINTIILFYIESVSK